MSRLWFTSDQHYDSERTLSLSKRPFKDTNEMNRYMIEKFNSVVSEDDYCIHLGDFGNYDVVRELNGTHAIVFGNYEIDDMRKMGSRKEFFDKLSNAGFDSVYTHHIVITYNNNPKESTEDVRFSDYGIEKLYITHKPEDCIKDNDKIFNLFGHIHALQKVRKYGLNVGVDCNHFYPVSFQDVKFYINAIKNHYDNNVFE